MTKYRIIIDTNLLHFDGVEDLSKIFRSDIVRISRFIVENKLENVKIVIPEVVIQERVAQRFRQIKDFQLGLQDFIAGLKKLDINLQEIELLPEDTKEKLQKKAQSDLELLKVEIAKSPDFKIEELLERALDKKPPIKSSNRQTDIAFKDTLIWLTVIEDAKNNENDNYIFATTNLKDFNPTNLSEEFLTVSKGQINFFSNIQEIEDFLDKEFKLQSTVVERRAYIVQKIKSFVGDIMFAIHQKFITGYNVVSPYSMGTADWYGANSFENAVGYQFLDLQVVEMTELDKGEIEVVGVVDTKVIIRPMGAASSFGGTTTVSGSLSTLSDISGYIYSSDLDKTRRFTLKAIYNTNSNDFKIIEIH